MDPLQQSTQYLVEVLSILHRQIGNDHPDLLKDLAEKELRLFYWRSVATLPNRTWAWSFVVSQFPPQLFATRESLWAVFAREENLVPVEMERHQMDLIQTLRNYLPGLVGQTPPPIRLSLPPPQPLYPPTLQLLNSPGETRGTHSDEGHSSVGLNHNNTSIATAQNSTNNTDGGNDGIASPLPTMEDDPVNVTGLNDQQWSEHSAGLVEPPPKESGATGSESSAGGSTNQVRASNGKEKSIVTVSPPKNTTLGAGSSSAPKKGNKSRRKTSFAGKARRSSPRQGRATRSDSRAPVKRVGPMLIIPPSEASVVEDLLRLDSYLCDESNLMKLPQSGIRKINMDRYEIFLCAKDKDTSTMDYVLDQLGILKSSILKYCERQVRLDPRTKAIKILENFSFIVTTKKAKAQYCHLDLLSPSFQFALAVSNNVPATTVYKVPSDIKKAQDLRKIWSDVPDSLVSAIERTPEAANLLRDYGNVLWDNPKRLKSVKDLKTGTVCSTPAGLHSGPSFDRPRAILFFTGVEKRSDSYDPDDQFVSATLLAEMAQNCWNEFTVNDREFVLQRLADIVRKDGNDGMVAILKGGAYAVADLCAQLVTHYNGRNKAIQTFLKENPSLKKYSEVEVKEKRAPKDNKLVRVSASGLFTKWWDGKEYRVEVFRKGSEIRLYYPSDDSWEGKGKNYKLLDLPNGILFDGENGSLVDASGREITCFQHKSRPSKRKRETADAGGKQRPRKARQRSSK